MESIKIFPSLHKEISFLSITKKYPIFDAPFENSPCIMKIIHLFKQNYNIVVLAWRIAGHSPIEAIARNRKVLNCAQKR